MEPTSDEIKRLQSCINDLISIVALPAVWNGREAAQIVSTLLDALLSMLRLDFAYARLNDRLSGLPVETVRFAQSSNLGAQPQPIGERLNRLLGDDSHQWPSHARCSIGDREFSIAPLRLGPSSDIGLLVAGSQRPDFPAETERLLLNIAANQAVVGLQESRQLNAQKRIADELEQKVAEQTRELTTLLEKIRASEAQLHQTIDTIPTLAWCMLPDGSNEFLSKRWHDYTGLSPEESHGWGWQASFHPEDLPLLMNRWRDLLRSGEPGEMEARLRRHDGAFRWFLIRVEPLRDGAGEIIRWYGTSTEIEDRKQAEERLRRDERELRLITDAIPVIVHVLDADGTVLHVNGAASDYFGLALGNASIADYMARFTHPEDLEKQDWTQAITRGLPFEYELRAKGKDGKYRWFLVRCYPLLDEQGDIIRWYATGTDIEDRKQAEERTRSENLVLREEVTRSSMFEEIVGSSQPLRMVLAQVTRVAPTDSTVLISGETGTGKELIARAIHNRSNRSARAFISVNCGAIPQSLIASEMFGHEKGAFTGAMQRRAGRFEAADGGTIFLDEVGELPMEAQIALLRVLQEQEFERIGSSERLKVDVRVLAATNRDLRRSVSAGTFRQDLFYRLNVFPIEMPPLRERPDDIALLAEYMISRYAKQAGKKFSNVTSRTLEVLQQYSWPGNVRELQNVIERAVVLCDGPTFSVDETWVTRDPTAIFNSVAPRPIPSTENERELIEAALAESRGRVSGRSGAAAKLGIPRQTLESRILRLGINKHRFRT